MSRKAAVELGESGSMTSPRVFERWVGMLHKAPKGMEDLVDIDTTGKPEGEFLFFTGVVWNDTMTGIDTVEFLMFYRRLYWSVQLTLEEAFNWYLDDVSIYLFTSNIPYYVFKEEYEKFSNGRVNEKYEDLIKEGFYNVKSEVTWNYRKNLNHKESDQDYSDKTTNVEEYKRKQMESFEMIKDKKPKTK